MPVKYKKYILSASQKKYKKIDLYKLTGFQTLYIEIGWKNPVFHFQKVTAIPSTYEAYHGDENHPENTMRSLVNAKIQSFFYFNFLQCLVLTTLVLVLLH